MRVELRRVQFMPKELEPGILYFAEEYGAAAHLCACGCGTKIRTPILPTEWCLDEGPNGPSLYPSVGNWQQKCRSHYWITDGEVVWSGNMTDEEIDAGREREVARRVRYYEERQSSAKRPSFWRWLRRWLSR